ncbi:MAG: hypothetical protein EAZ89_10835 [Bacteroidetes bacterium]|jgi:hypothetical protein|nr:MAG: hypothetical protein EAZ89_10835 [Bacteroidota bacterium]
MTFEDFLKSKRIDSAAFRAARPEEWESWRQLFEAMGPVSFDYQKKYFFNPVRRSFLLSVTEPEKPAEEKKPALSGKPKLVMKPSLKPPKTENTPPDVQHPL